MAELPSWMVDPQRPSGDETREMRVAAKRPLAEGVIELELVPVDGAAPPSWEPGAHVDLHLPGGAIRQYSLCGVPTEKLRVAVLREAEGRGGSLHLHDVTAVGDTLAVGAPRNNFALAPSRRYLFIAGGIGITPLIPMIAMAQGAGSEWSLLYGGRTRRSMAFLDLLEGSDEVTIAPQDEVGLLDLDAALGASLADTLVYCCGPEPLLAAVEEASAHWPPGALHLERFKQREDIPDDDGAAFEVVLARSGISLTVAPGQSILDAVSKAGVPVPSSCQEGTCGTCETIVLEGEPEHRDSVLTPADQAAGDCMMICCSRARGERLVLDL
jgi:ferredoxin-NADP reductase